MTHMTPSPFIRVALFLCMIYVTGCVTHESLQYAKEIVWEGYDPVLRKKLVSMLDEERIQHVSFTNMPTLEAIRWLSNRHSQSIGLFSNQKMDEDTLGVVNFTLTNATFFSVLDRICQQNGFHWGFKENILLMHPDSFLYATPGWSHLVKPGGPASRNEQYTAFLRSVILPPFTFKNKTRNDIFDAIRLKALTEIAKQDGWFFSVVIDPLDSVAATHQNYTFSLEPLSVYDSFMRAGALTDVPVAFTNGVFFVGAGAVNEKQERRASKDEQTYPSK
jgi:hypothetical protein